MMGLVASRIHAFSASRVLPHEFLAAAAADRFGTAIGHLEEMRQGLTGTDLTQFLGRPVTASFVVDAGVAFQQANRGQDADRLRAILQP